MVTPCQKRLAVNLGKPWNGASPLLMDGWEWKISLTWMITRGSPQLRKPPYDGMMGNSPLKSLEARVEYRYYQLGRLKSPHQWRLMLKPHTPELSFSHCFLTAEFRAWYPHVWLSDAQHHKPYRPWEASYTSYIFHIILSLQPTFFHPFFPCLPHIMLNHCLTAFPFFSIFPTCLILLFRLKITFWSNNKRGVSINGGTPSYHPFLDGIFLEINHPAIEDPFMEPWLVSVGLEPPFPMIFHHIVGFVNHPLESVNYGFYGNLGLFFSYC